MSLIFRILLDEGVYSFFNSTSTSAGYRGTVNIRAKELEEAKERIKRLQLEEEEKRKVEEDKRMVKRVSV